MFTENGIAVMSRMGIDSIFKGDQIMFSQMTLF